MNLSSISETNASSRAIGSTSNSTAASVSSEFITLLTAQMMNQDPTEPMESHEVTAQLAQIASLEQQEGTNQLMGNLLSMVGTLGNYSALNTVGKDATVVIDQFQYNGGSFSGEIPVEDAQLDGTFKVEIKDESGKVIQTIDTEVVDGKVTWQWDGTDSNGNQMSTGVYQISAYEESTQEAEVTKIPMLATTTSKIESINFINGLAELENGIEVMFGNIISISNSSAGETGADKES